MHRTKSTTAALFSAIVIALSVGCGSPGASAPADTGAVRLEDWSTVNNLFRDGQMYFGGQPDEASFGRLASQEGVRTVINIRYPEEMNRVDFDERAAVESLGMKYITIPVSPETFSVDDVSRFAEVLSATDEPVLLHCASSNRVGGMWAAYLALHRGIDIDEAIVLGRAAGLRSESMVDATRRVAGDG
jgi:uncharacterized protein (TIGR01244 family)